MDWPQVSMLRSVKASGSQFQYDHATVGFDQIIAGIRSSKYAQRVQRFRDGDADAKIRLPAFTPSMQLTSEAHARTTEAPHHHTGIIGLDFDHVDNSTGALVDTLRDMNSICGIFVSPSGEGVKAFFRVHPIPNNAKEHGQAFEQIADKVNTTLRSTWADYDPQWLDKSGRDVSRACFMSWDPNAWITNSWEHTQPISWRMRSTNSIDEPAIAAKNGGYADYDPRWIALGEADLDRNLPGWLQQLKTSQPGSRHDTYIRKVLIPVFRRLVVPYSTAETEADLEYWRDKTKRIMGDVRASVDALFPNDPQRVQFELRQASGVFDAVRAGRYGGAFRPNRSQLRMLDHERSGQSR